MKKKERTKKSKPRELTEKQKKFIAYYTGNGTDAARKAGYHGDDEVLRSVAYENLTKPHIRALIRKRCDADIEPLIESRLGIKKFLSKVMHSTQTSMRDRLKAVELLGKAEAMFTDNVNQKSETKVTIISATQEQIDQSVDEAIKDL